MTNVTAEQAATAVTASFAHAKLLAAADKADTAHWLAFEQAHAVAARATSPEAVETAWAPVTATRDRLNVALAAVTASFAKLQK